MSKENLPSPAELNEDDEDSMGRRGFIKLVGGAFGACYAAAIGYPIYRYLDSPVEEAAQETAVTQVTLPPDAIHIPKNSALMFRFGYKPSMLIHHDDDTWTALSAVCTHLGCTAGYVPARKVIYCPCHGGTYNATTGGNISGPPPKPLTLYKVQISDGKITVSRT